MLAAYLELKTSFNFSMACSSSFVGGGGEDSDRTLSLNWSDMITFWFMAEMASDIWRLCTQNWTWGPYNVDKKILKVKPIISTSFRIANLPTCQS